MRPVTVSKTGTGQSDPIILDAKLGFPVGLYVVVSGTATATIQHTSDNLWTNAAPLWRDADDPNMVALTGNVDGIYASIPFATRINVTAGAGTVSLTAFPTGQKG